MNFSSLNLHPELLRALTACGYHDMTPVQEQTCIPARRGKDLVAIAQTGTGKTAAFAVPVLQQLMDDEKNQGESIRPRALILTPTRELAEQLADTIGAYAQFLPLTVTAVYGGAKMTGQENKLRAGTDVLIATPGRLLEHIAQCNVDLAAVRFVVLDEADRMLDMGFVADVKSLVALTASTHQTLLYSATLSPAVNVLADALMRQHQVVRVNKENVTAQTVKQRVYPVEEERKAALFIDLLSEHNWFQVLVFTSTKDQADRLLGELQRKRIDAAVCHGDKSQGARRRALADFKSAKIQVLIATEVAARGLDIQGLDIVINYNLPYLAEDYVHRIGRTGRAGQSGTALSFVNREEERSLDAIQRLIGQQIKRVVRPGFEVTSRDALIAKATKGRRQQRSNKATKTEIKTSKNAVHKPKKNKLSSRPARAKGSRK